MKKMFAAGLAALLGLSVCAFGAGISAGAAETYEGPDFFDDFESYTVESDANYDSRQIGANWTNGWLTVPADGKADSECADNKFSITTDPLDPDNKVLHMDTATTNSSFFYLTPKEENADTGIRVKNFEVSFRFLAAEGGDAYWFGIAARKAVDTRYNATNCVMMNARMWSRSEFSPQGFRQLGQSGLLLSLMNEDRSAELVTPTIADDMFAAWHTYKLVVNDNEFDMYIDGQHFGGATITQTSANGYGYLSLISTVANVYIDDFTMTNNDTEAPPEEGDDEPEDPLPDLSPVLTGESAFTYTQGGDTALAVGVDVKDQVITRLDANNRAVMSRYYSYANGTFSISADYLNSLDAGEYEFVLGTDGGEVSFTVTIEGGSEGGCGSSVAGGAALIGAGLAAAAGIVIRKKRI